MQLKKLTVGEGMFIFDVDEYCEGGLQCDWYPDVIHPWSKGDMFCNQSKSSNDVVIICDPASML